MVLHLMLPMWLLSALGVTYTLVVAEGNALLWKDAQGDTLPSESVAQNIGGAAFRCGPLQGLKISVIALVSDTESRNGSF
jgi:hypothetical protein